MCEPAPLEALSQALDNVCVLDERHREHVGHGVSRHVVVGRPQAAGENHEVDALERTPYELRDLAPVVADDGLCAQLDAEG